MNGNGNKNCSICSGATKGGARCVASPFAGLCCEDCYDRFVQPVRLIFGAAASHQMMQAFRSIAKEGRRILDQKKIDAAMLEAAHSTCDEPDS